MEIVSGGWKVLIILRSFWLTHSDRAVFLGIIDSILLCFGLDLMEQLIINALKKACGNKNIKFQVIIQDEQLHIYANHRQNYHPHYSALEENVGAAIAALNLTTIDSVWLYARPLGQTEPNWRVFVELPTQSLSKTERDTEGNNKFPPVAPIDPLDNLPDLESLIDIEERGDYDPTIMSSTGDTGKIKRQLHQEEFESVELDFTDEIEFTDFVDSDVNNSLGDTGLLQETGFVHGSPLKEAEISGLYTKSSPNQTKLPEVAVTTAKTLDRYCFITDRQLLTSEVDPPEKETMRLVKFFHHLSESDRLQLLPILDSYFRTSATPGLETTLPAIQNWMQKIQALDEAERHLFAVWLSRYCFKPEETLEEFKQISAARVAESNNKSSQKAKSTTEYSFVSLKPRSYSATDEELELDEPKFQLPPIVKQLLLPVIWILATVLLIILGIASHNSQIVVTSSQIPAICSQTTGSPEYCRLAVNLVGEKTITQTPASLFPLTEVTETIADYGCGRYANLKAGIDIDKIAPATTPVISTYGEKVFPHIYAIEVVQKYAQQHGNVRVGCIYTAGKGQRSPEKLAADVIPLNWPAEHYQSQTSSSSSIAFGVYSQPIKLSLYTIFAALGIAIASRLNLGLKINRSHTVYLVALLLGMVQLTISLLPAFNLLWGMLIPLAVILTASLLLKDFRLDWRRGYPSIAISVLAIVAVQLLFYSFCLQLISGLI